MIRRLAVMLLPLAFAALPAQAEIMVSLLPGSDLPGKVLQTHKDIVTRAECIDLCFPEEGCTAVLFRDDGGSCTLLSAASAAFAKPAAGVDAVLVFDRDAAALRRQRLADLQFLHADLRAAANRQVGLQGRYPVDGDADDIASGAITAMKDGNQAVAVRAALIAATFAGLRSDLWRDLASVALATPSADGLGRLWYRQQAAAAALNAYATAVTDRDRAAALAGLAQARAAQEQWSDAAALARLATSLLPDPALEQAAAGWQARSKPLPPLAASPASQDFADWTLVCDNAGRCTAIGFAAAGSYQEMTLEISRDAGPAAAPEAALRMAVGNTPYGGEPVFDVPGFEAVFHSGEVLTGPVAHFTVSPDSLSLLMTAMQKARALQMAMDEDGKTVTRVISLAGAADALRAMDRIQQRTGTLTALIDRGAAPAASVPPAPPVPVVKVALGKGSTDEARPPLQVLHAWRLACGNWQRTEADGRREATAHGADQGEPRWWLINCGFSGLTGATAMPLLQRGAIVTTLPVETITGGRLEARLTDLREASLTRGFPWEDRAREDDQALPLVLTEREAGRGQGDCGTIRHHMWDGTAFRLVEEQYLHPCRGRLPPDWPVRWRAEAQGMAFAAGK